VKKAPPPKTKADPTPPEAPEPLEYTHDQYVRDCHAAHVLRRNSLGDCAFKTSERYDQWILTIAGGALAVSLTFIEKIAPQPSAATLWILVLSWLAYIVALLSAFAAIYVSREALYREIEIDEVAYDRFRKTTTPENPCGEMGTAEENKHRRRLEILNKVSLASVGAGTLLMCLFALCNVGGSGKTKKAGETSPLSVNLNISSQVPVSTNAAAPATVQTQTNIPGSKAVSLLPQVSSNATIVTNSGTLTNRTKP